MFFKDVDCSMGKIEMLESNIGVDALHSFLEFDSNGGFLKRKML